MIAVTIATGLVVVATVATPVAANLEVELKYYTDAACTTEGTVWMHLKDSTVEKNPYSSYSYTSDCSIGYCGTSGPGVHTYKVLECRDDGTWLYDRFTTADCTGAKNKDAATKSWYKECTPVYFNQTSAGSVGSDDGYTISAYVKGSCGPVADLKTEFKYYTDAACTTEGTAWMHLKDNTVEKNQYSSYSYTSDCSIGYCGTSGAGVHTYKVLECRDDGTWLYDRFTTADCTGAKNKDAATKSWYKECTPVYFDQNSVGSVGPDGGYEISAYVKGSCRPNPVSTTTTRNPYESSHAAGHLSAFLALMVAGGSLFM